MDSDRFEQHPHNPPHLFRPGGTYFVTVSTRVRQPAMQPPHRRQECFESWQFATAKRSWRLIAWVFLPDHYHLLTTAPDGDDDIARLAGSVHQFTAREWNREDGSVGRQVWWNFRHTCVSYERSFYARLNYIHWNPVKHGLVAKPEDYPLSSYKRYREEWESLLRFWEAEYPFERLDEEPEGSERRTARGDEF
jgi:putative transposase